MQRVKLLLAVLLVAVSCTARSARQATTSPAPSAPSPTGSGAEVPLRVVAVGDIGDGSREAAAVASSIADLNSDEPFQILLLLGDLIYPDGDPAEYEQKFGRLYRPVLDSGVEAWAVLGNHDIETDSDSLMRAFSMPSRYYTLERRAARFFALDSSNGSIDRVQSDWLEAQLARPFAGWKIAFTHVPPFSSGDHGPAPAVEAALAGPFKRHGVRLLVAGHNHYYERTVEIEGTVHVVSGGGCCPRPSAASAITAYSASLLHFVVLEIYKDSLEIKAVDSKGKVFDRAFLSRAAAQAA